MDINALLSALSIQGLGFNWIDVLILVVVVFYGFEGYALGFYAALVDLISFIVSFALGLVYYGVIGGLLMKIFSMPAGFANAIGFFVVAFITEIITGFVLRHLILTLPLIVDFEKQPVNIKRLNNALGILPAIFSGLLLLAFILTMIIILPVSTFLKHSVTDSKVGSVLVTNTQGFAKDLNNVFGGAVNETLAFMTVEPKSNEIVKLNFKTGSFSVDLASEAKMYAAVNKERVWQGVPTLQLWNKLTAVGRAHCEDMLERGYFSHYTLEGLSPFDRMAQADINFTFAGENLALAPNTELAMQGLMQSPGHRANILSTDFHRIGIGVIDGGVYGEMFCQEFTD